MIRKIVKSLLQFPADAVIGSSKRLDPQIDRAIRGNPHLSAKFYPHQPHRASYLVPKASRAEQTPGAELPIPPLDLRQHSYLGPDPEAYLAGGKKFVQKMVEILGRSGISVEPGKRVLDFGCGDGMMVRQFREIAEVVRFGASTLMGRR